MSDTQQAYRLFLAGRLAEAQSLLEPGVEAFPREQPGQFLLALIEMEQGNIGRGLQRLATHISDFVPPFALCRRLGELGLAQGEHALAAQWLRKALQQEPANAGAHNLLGNALRMHGDPAGAERAYRESIRLAPVDEQGHIGLAFLYRSAHRLDEAADAMWQLVQNCAGNSMALQKAMSFFEDIQRTDLAERAGSALLPLESGDAAFLCRLGRLREKLGRFDEAADCFRRALGQNPSMGSPVSGLLTARKYTSARDPDAERIRRALETAGVSEDGVICAHFALAKILDDCDLYAEAFTHAAQANSLRARQSSFDLPAYRARLQRLRQPIGATPPRARPGAPVPVFVVGMLRSGTTLTESILGAHPRIAAAGELDHIEAIAERLGLGTLPDAAARVTSGMLQDAADGYLAELAAFARKEACVVDKNPGNYAYLGLIASLFPNARIVHCRRDPLDTCLSIYFRNFARDANAWAYDLESIADVYLEYRALMDHWRARLPLGIHEIDYETLVREPEAETRRLLEFLDLPFDERCLDFQKQSRSVGTASLWQVRQPLYRDAIGRWRHYAAQLTGLEQRLALK